MKTFYRIMLDYCIAVFLMSIVDSWGGWYVAAATFNLLLYVIAVLADFD